MPRAIKGAATRRARKRVLKRARGHRGAAGRHYRLAKEAVVRAAVYARVGRRLRKRSFRRLWVLRLSAACRQRGVRYSEFINGLKKAKILLNRKMLSEIAIADPAGFDALINAAKTALA